jgi:uncharacterized damage-inducible protein DinB
MTPEQATFLLQEVYLPQIQSEQAITARVIAAVPIDRCDYKPDPKSMGALELAWHIASTEPFFMDGVVNGQYVHGGGKMPDSIKTPADVVAWYNTAFAASTAKLAQLKGEDLVRNIDFFGVFNMTGIEYIKLMCSHSVHHRGQLSAYLRPMGAKVPGIYGPSGDADIPESAQAAAH